MNNHNLDDKYKNVLKEKYEVLNKKFKDIEYTRPDFSKAKEELKEIIKIIRNAKDYETVRGAFVSANNILIDLESAAVVCGIRNTIDTSDKYYEDEDLYISGEFSNLSVVLKDLNVAILKSKFVKELEEEYGSLLIKTMENEQKLVNSKIVPIEKKEYKLCSEYSKEVSMCKTTYQGEDCNFYGLLKFMESTDRNIRRGAFQEWAKLYEDVSGKLDDIYDKLIDLRIDKANKLGFDSYIDYAYLSFNRFDYNKDDVKIFREEVKKYIVPLANKLYEEQANRLGIDKLHWYDEALSFKEGNANPIGNKDELVSKAKEMYSDLSNETKEFFEFMTDHDLFDLETRHGKRLGGYCTFINLYKAPFIFSNFNGTSQDVDVLTHEAGHAFQAYTASRNLKLASQVWAGMETSEIHSMSMEHFTYPYMDKFFGENSNKYLYHHLTNALMTIPYLVCVDLFQHKVFENPKMTALERRKIWRDIEKEYMPWRDYEDNEFLNNGGFWMQKQHIFLHPFYYIDYALAQTCAFQFLIKYRNDFDSAWNDYLNLCKAGGSKGYLELLDLAHLNSPFKEGTVKEVVSEVEKIIKEFKNYI